jgi:hypothetical protein
MGEVEAARFIHRTFFVNPFREVLVHVGYDTTNIVTYIQRCRGNVPSAVDMFRRMPVFNDMPVFVRDIIDSDQTQFTFESSMFRNRLFEYGISDICLYLVQLHPFLTDFDMCVRWLSDHINTHNRRDQENMLKWNEDD